MTGLATADATGGPDGPLVVCLGGSDVAEGAGFERARFPERTYW